MYRLKLYALFIYEGNETMICYREVPFKAGLTVILMNTFWVK